MALDNDQVQFGRTPREFVHSELRKAKAAGYKRGEVTCRNHGTQWVPLARVYGRQIFTDTQVHGLDDRDRPIVLVCTSCRRAWDMDRKVLGRALNRTMAHKRPGAHKGHGKLDVEEVATRAVISVP